MPATDTDVFAAMLGELEGNCLRVELVPLKRETNVGGCRRVAASRNAVWYQKFCAKHPSGRKRKNAAFDTRIKRRDIVRILTRLSRGLPSRSKYVPELQAISRRFEGDPF